MEIPPLKILSDIRIKRSSQTAHYIVPLYEVEIDTISAHSIELCQTNGQRVYRSVILVV